MLISVAGHRPGCAILQSTDPSLAAVQTAAPSSRRCAVSPLVEQTGRFTSKQAFDSPTAFSDNQYVPSTGFAYGVELCILIRVYSIVYDLLPLLSRAVLRAAVPAVRPPGLSPRAQSLYVLQNGFVKQVCSDFWLLHTTAAISSSSAPSSCSRLRPWAATASCGVARLCRYPFLLLLPASLHYFQLTAISTAPTPRISL